jgi:hypothetical protein
MNKQTKEVFFGYLRLSSEEKSELVKEMNKFINMDSDERISFKESFSVHLGPVSDDICPCCGK